MISHTGTEAGLVVIVLHSCTGKNRKIPQPRSSKSPLGVEGKNESKISLLPGCSGQLLPGPETLTALSTAHMGLAFAFLLEGLSSLFTP